MKKEVLFLTLLRTIFLSARHTRIVYTYLAGRHASFLPDPRAHSRLFPESPLNRALFKLQLKNNRNSNRNPFLIIHRYSNKPFKRRLTLARHFKQREKM